MYSKEELLEIYYNLKHDKIINKELIPIKDQLLFVIKRVKFKHLFALNDLIDVLFYLYKENKLSIIDQELMDFSKQIGDDTYIPSFIFGITHNNDRFTNNVLINSNIIFSLGVSFTAFYKASIRNPNNHIYIKKINNVYTNIAIKYSNLKQKLINKNYKEIDMYILGTVLEIITTMVYINIDSYLYDYDLIETCMNEIEDNLLKYFIYFIENQLWCIDIGVVPKSVGGFEHEFIVIGNLVNKIYLDKQKKLNLSI